MGCLTDNDLVELLEDRLPADRRTAVLAELEQCDTCRALARDWALSSIRIGEPPVEKPTAPAEVGAYRLEELLGAGAMGLVFRARDTALDRAVAIKLIAAPTEAARAAALHEARLLATVRHRNVIAVHAAGAAGDLAYLVMELVDGTSLDRVLPAPWPTAARWFAGVARGLAAAHAAGVIHRDIKPANLLLDRDELRVADFGLAATHGGAPAGTLAYLAPELADGAPATAASDQFALCVALYEAIAGRRPFAGATIDELATSWHAGVTAWPRMPARIRRIIARGLAVDPKRRWPDLEAVSRALAAAARSRRAIWLGAAGFAAVAALATWSLTRTGSAQCDAPDPGWAARTAAWPPAPHELAATREHRWRDAYARTCTGPLAARQRACLVDARAQLDAVLDEVGAHPDTRAIADGAQALATAIAPERCLTAPDASDPSAAAARRAEALQALGRSREARAALPPPEHDGPALAFLRGRIARDLQDNDGAVTALRRAVELASRDDAGGVLADAQLELAVVVGISQSLPDAGMAYADASLATAQRIGDHQRAAAARAIQGLMTYGRGDAKTAVATLTAAIDELGRTGASPMQIAAAEQRLSWVLRDIGRTSEARPHAERALAARRAALGAAHPLVGLTEIELGYVDVAEGKHAAAIERFRAIIDRLTRVVGPEHGAVINGWEALGRAQMETGDYRGAEASCAQVLALRRKALGERHTDVARAYSNLGWTQYLQDKHAEALASFRAAEVVARSIFGGNHYEVATIKIGIAQALRGQNKLDDAAVAVSEAVAIYRALPGQDAPLADALLTLGLIEMQRDKYAASRAELEESYDIRRRMVGDDSVELATVLSAMGELYRAIRRFDDAQRVAQQARDLRAKHGAAPALLAENDFSLAEIAWARGQRDQARKLARSALAMVADARPDLRADITEWLRTH